MPNAFNNPTIFAKEMLRHLENNCYALKMAYREPEADWLATYNGWKAGQTINVRCPLYFRVKSGWSIDLVNIVDSYVTMPAPSPYHVAYTITPAEAALEIDPFSDRIIKPAMLAIGDFLDRLYFSTMYKNIPNEVGTPGTAPSYRTYLEAYARLERELAPKDDRYCIINAASGIELRDQFKGLFLQEMVGGIVQRGKLSENLNGFRLYETENVPRHTVGTWPDGSNLVDDTVAEGDTDINFDQNGVGAAYTLKAGDIFSIAATNAVNKVSGVNSGQLRQFVVTADTVYAEAIAMGGDYNVTPAIIPGTSPWKIYSASATEDYLPYQNVHALPLNNAVITPVGTNGQTYTVNLAFHRECAALCMIPVPVPDDIKWKATIAQNGVAISCAKEGTIDDLSQKIRFDIYCSIKTINPFLGCRIAGE